MQKIREKLIRLMSDIKNKEFSVVCDTDTFNGQLEFDSLEFIELLSAIDLEFKFSMVGKIKITDTFADLVNVIAKMSGIPIEEPKKITKYWCHYNCTHNQGGQDQLTTLGFIYETEGEFSTADIGKTQQKAMEILNAQLGVEPENVKSTILTFFGKLED